MIEQELLSARRSQLVAIIRDSLSTNEPHSKAFALRVLTEKYSSEIPWQQVIEASSDEIIYGGYPQVASLGFQIGAGIPIPPDHGRDFQTGIERLRSRSAKGLRSFSGDDIAILGVADGLARVRSAQPSADTAAAMKWLIGIVDDAPDMVLWTCRVRDLAGDLLDDRGRLRTSPGVDSVSAKALGLVLRSIWPEQFGDVPVLSEEAIVELLRALLSDSPPEAGDLEEAAVWLGAIDLLVGYACETLLTRQGAAVVSMLKSIKAKLDQKAVRRVRRLGWLIIALLLLAGVVLAVLTHYFGWNVMEPWTYFVGFVVTLGGYAYFVMTSKEWSPSAIHQQMIGAAKRKLYQDLGFDPEEYGRIVTREVSSTNGESTA